MRSKDISLSASLMAIYIAISVAGSVSPIAISALAVSALFGMFWPYFSTKRNLTFQGLRVGFNLLSFVRTAPKIISYMRMQSIMGLGIFDWITKRFGGIIDVQSTELLTTVANLETGLTFWVFVTGYAVAYCLIVPYLFYRYFKAVGLFKRLPEF